MSRVFAVTKRPFPPTEQPLPCKKPKLAVPVPLTATQTRLRLMWVHRCAPYNRIFHDVVREVCSYIEDPLIVEVWDDLVGFFDTKTHSWEKYVSLEEMELNCSYASYVRLDVGRLFVAGIMSPRAGLRSLSYIFHFGSGGFSLEKMPQMRVSREMAGLLHYANTVYIFGGLRVKRDSALSVTNISRSVEFLGLGTAQWRKTGQRMSCRRIRVTPCEHRGKAYLCGGYPRYDRTMTCIEVFRLKELCFDDPIYLPLPVEASVVAYVADDELVLMANSCIVKLNLEDSLAVSRIERQPNLCCCAARGTPILCGAFIYWTYSRTCMRLNYTESPMEVEKFEMIRGLKSRKSYPLTIVL